MGQVSKPRPASSADPWAALNWPAFRWYVSARTASMLGNAVAPVALAFAVLDLTGSARDVGYVVAAQSLMRVLILLFGGVLADRLPRNLVLVGSCLLAGLTQGAAAVAVLSGTATIALLVVLAAANGLMSGLSLPSSMAMVPQTVPPGLLRQANATGRLFANAALIGGGALGGIVVVTVGPGWGLAFDGASFLVAAACYQRIRLLGSPPAAPSEGFLRQLRAGGRSSALAPGCGSSSCSSPC